MIPNLLRYIISVRQSNIAAKPYEVQRATIHAIK